MRYKINHTTINQQINNSLLIVESQETLFVYIFTGKYVITSYSIHYTKLYDFGKCMHHFQNTDTLTSTEVINMKSCFFSTLL